MTSTPDKKRPILWPVFFATIAILLAIALSQLPSITQKKLEKFLHVSGFPSATVGTSSLSFREVEARDIKLDQYGFDEIDSLKADIDWPEFLFGERINGLTVSGVRLGRDASNIGSTTRGILTYFTRLPPYRIALSDVTLDMTTDFGELRFTMEGSIDNNASGGREIRGRIDADQYQLSFKSEWQGTVAADGTLDLSGNVPEGRINAGPLRVSRFNGWIGAGTGVDGMTIQSQMQAGSANFMALPLESLSFAGSYSAKSSTALVRAGLSGVPDVLFSADYNGGQDISTFDAVLTGRNLGNLLDYVEEATGHKKEIRDTLLQSKNFQFTARYEPEKRFVGGPLPFALALQTGTEDDLAGNFLFYPENFDVRGSLETTPDMALALQDYFKISPRNMRENFIRLDGNIRKHFFADDLLAAPPALLEQ